MFSCDLRKPFSYYPIFMASLAMLISGGKKSKILTSVTYGCITKFVFEDSSSVPEKTLVSCYLSQVLTEDFRESIEIIHASIGLRTAFCWCSIVAFSCEFSEKTI